MSVVNGVVNPASLYHPPNLYPLFDGVGNVAIVPPFATTIGVTSLPPFELNVTVCPEAYAIT